MQKGAEQLSRKGVVNRVARQIRLAKGQYMDLLLLFGLAMLWGSSYLFIKIVVSEVPAFTLVAGRLTLATVIMWGILRFSGLSMPRSRRIWEGYAVLGFFNVALPFSLISWGEQYIPSGLAALLQATTPIFAVILAQFLTDDDRITPAKIIGVLIGFVGVGVLMLPDLRQGLQASLLGQLAVVGSSLCYAGATIFARSRLRGQPPLVSATGQLTMGAAAILPASLLIDRPVHLSPSLPVLASWLGLVILGTVSAYFVYFTLLDRARATFVTTVTYIIPINGLILGALVLHERLDVTTLGSLALVLLGVLVVRS